MRCTEYDVLCPPQRCVTYPVENGEESPLELMAEDIMEALELSTELLVAPIEFTAQKESPSEIQQRFYKRKAELEKIKGPSSSEKDRTMSFDSILEKEVFLTHASMLCRYATSEACINHQRVLCGVIHPMVAGGKLRREARPRGAPTALPDTAPNCALQQSCG